jgi:hypothetical protein
MLLIIIVEYPQKNTNFPFAWFARWGDILTDDRMLEPDIDTPLIKVDADRELVAIARSHKKNAP